MATELTIYEGVGTLNSAQKTYRESIELIKTLLGGTKDMRAAGTKYLPQEEGETNESYQNRLVRTVLLNIFKRTCLKLSGEVFSKPIVFTDSMDSEIVDWCKDIDHNGNNLTVFAYNTFTQAISHGLSIVLVDYNHIEVKKIAGKPYYKDESGDWKLKTKKAEKENGWRPYFVLIDPTTVLGCKTGLINGIERLTQLRIEDEIEVEDGEYGSKSITRIRFFEIGSYKTFYNDPDSKEDLVLHDSGYTGLDFIPVFAYMTGKKISTLTAELPMEDLADLNNLHWQSSSDQRNILHYARLITFFGRNLDLAMEDKKVTVGANKLVHSSDPNGDLKVVEHSGDAIEAGRKDLQDLEQQMALFGLSIMLPKSDRATATEKMIDTSESDSILKNWALSFQDFVNLLMNTLKKYAQITNDGSATVNTELKSIFNSYSLEIIISSYREGVITREVAAIELKKRNIIDEETNIDQMVKDLEKIDEDNLKKEVKSKNTLQQ